MATNWNDVLLDHDVNSSFNTFFDKFMLLYNENVPIVKKKVKRIVRELHVCHGLVLHC